MFSLKTFGIYLILLYHNKASSINIITLVLAQLDQLPNISYVNASSSATVICDFGF